MTFGVARYNKKYEYELLRYCASHNVVGGVEMLFKYFVDNYKPSSIVSYCDTSKFSGKGTSNEELILNRGYLPIYDCGQATYVWHSHKNIE